MSRFFALFKGYVWLAVVVIMIALLIMLIGHCVFAQQLQSVRPLFQPAQMIPLPPSQMPGFTMRPLAGPEPPLFFEVDAKVVFANYNVILSGDTDINLQDVGLPNRTTPKLVGVTASIRPNMRFRYYFTCPIKEEGKGLIGSLLVLNGVKYGTTSGQDKKDLWVQHSFLSHRFELDYAPIVASNGQTYVIGSVEYIQTGLMVKGKVDGGTGGSDQTETSATSNRFLLGAGMGGYYRDRGLLFKYRAIYNFLDKDRGWLLDADVRYDIARRGFLGVGYLYQDYSVSLDATRLKSRIYGPYFEAGLLF